MCKNMEGTLDIIEELLGTVDRIQELQLKILERAKNKEMCNASTLAFIIFSFELDDKIRKYVNVLAQKVTTEGTGEEATRYGGILLRFLKSLIDNKEKINQLSAGLPPLEPEGGDFDWDNVFKTD